MEMIARFDEKALAAALDRLPELYRTVFAAACAERLMPAYDAFARRSGRGDPKALGDILARLWDDLAGNWRCLCRSAPRGGGGLAVEPLK
jgi:hypothetical protein